jgi:hypothetical protein
MTNPPYILEHLDGIAKILNLPNVYSFLHVPVQAASNKVLLAMNREYTIEEFKLVVDTLKKHVPNVTIATDIICGFPGEDEDDFEQTIDMVKHYALPIVNISQFYPRPGTPAARMKRISTQIVKERSRKLTKLFESFTPYINLVGRALPVYFDVEISDDGLHSVGHSKAYVKILVKRDLQLPGRCYLVNIISASRFHCNGEIIELIHKSNQEIQNEGLSDSQGSGVQQTFLSASKNHSIVIDISEKKGDFEGEGACANYFNCNISEQSIQLSSTIVSEDHLSSSNANIQSKKFFSIRQFQFLLRASAISLIFFTVANNLSQK